MTLNPSCSPPWTEVHMNLVIPWGIPHLDVQSLRQTGDLSPGCGLPSPRAEVVWIEDEKMFKVSLV